MKVQKPIFIIGLGRSGSTAFYKIFSKHPQVAWLSGLCNRYPDKLWMNRLLMEIIDYPIIGNIVQKRLQPGECYGFWEFYCKGFSRPCRDLLAEDVTIKSKNRLQKTMSMIPTEKRHRLLIKITGWPRIGFLHEIFDNVKFIHIVRNEKAVITSFLNVSWWLGWRGPQNWRWGELTPTQKEEWEKYNCSFIALAAIQWTIFMDALKKAKRIIDVKKDFLEIQYELMCLDPMTTFKKIIEFCELEWSEKFENDVRQFRLESTNYKWEEELTVSQRNIIDAIVQNYLDRSLEKN
jgi:sulfotransferase family protein